MAVVFKNGIWSCGFDFLADGAPSVGGVFDVAALGSISSSNARFTGKGIRFTGGNPNNGLVARSLGVTLTSIYTGIAMYADTLPSVSFNAITFASGNTPLFNVGYNSSGNIAIYTGGQPNGNGSSTLLSGTSVTPLVYIIPGSYGFLEIFATFSASVGQIIVRWNNAVVLSFSGLNTGAGCNRVCIGAQVPSGSATAVRFDDWYILDGTGAAPNNQFLGNGRIQTDVATGNSLAPGLAQWAFTTPSGSAWQNAGNIPANAARFNTGTPNQRMMMLFPTLVASRVFFLNTWLSVEEDSAGTCGLSPCFRSNGIDQLAAEITMPGSFTYFNQNSVIDPNTGFPWYSGAAAAAGAAEIGVTRTS